MDIANSVVSSGEIQPFLENVSVTPPLVDDQGDIFQCGKCKANYSTLIEFLSHKREHISPNILDLSSQIIIKNDNAKMVTFTQPSNQIWVWNAHPVAEFNNSTISSDEDRYRVDQLSVKQTNETIVIEQQECIEDTEVLVTFPEKFTEPSHHLTCSVCQRVFKKQFDLFLHFRSHTGEKPFQCIVCGRTFAHKSNLKKHVSTHRVWPDGLSKTLPQHCVGSDLGYTCPCCQKLLTTYLNLKIHLKEHGHQKVYKCVQRKCMAMFVDLDSLISHININHQIAEYHCHLCSVTLSSLKEMSNHQQTHNPNTSKTKQVMKHTCIYCRATFNKPDHLSHHLSTASHVNNCSHCTKSFVSERALRRHLILHDASRNIRCNVCGLTFKTKNYLVSHMLTHSKEKNFVCTICNVKFSRKDILMRHIKIHQPNKKKHCPFRSHLGCMMEFTRTDKLNQHVKSHTDKIHSKRKPKRNSKQIEDSEHSTMEIIIVPLSDTQCSDPT